MTSNIQNVTEAAGEAGTASGKVLTAAGELNTNAVTLETEITSFIRQVRNG